MAVAAAPMPVREQPDSSPVQPAWVPVVEAAARGDEFAFRRLHREFGPMVHGLLLARVNAASADDLTQEVFLRAWRGLDRLHEPRAWPGYLTTIARNAAIDHVRRDRRSEPLPLELVPPTAQPDAALRVEAERLLEIIRELPEAYVEPLVLRLVEGLSGPEIAERMSLSPGYVRVNLHRGMKLLRERLERQRGGRR